MNRFDKITKHFVLILIFCMTFLSSCCGPNPAVKAAEGDTHWARSTVIASNESRYNAITTDISGNIYAAGKIHGTGEFEFGNGATVTALTSINLLLVKYNSNGNTQWAKSLVAASHKSEYTSVATDNNGNVYAIGYIDGTGQFDFGNGVSIAGCAQKNPIIVKYNSNGDAQWAKTALAAPSQTEFNGITTDSSGGIYVAGHITGTGEYDFGNETTIAGSSITSNAVVVKYNSVGDAQWAKSTVISPSQSEFSSVATGSGGDIYVGGHITGTGEYDFGNETTIAGSYISFNAVVVKYNSVGDAQWAKSTAVAPHNSLFHSVTSDNDGNVYAAGKIRTSGQYDFGEDVTVAGGYSSDYNAVIVKYGSNGDTEWASSLVVAPNLSEFDSIAVDNNGNLYVSGYLFGGGEYNFGDGVTMSAGAIEACNGILVRYDSSGSPQWVKTTLSAPGESPNGSNFFALTIDSNNNLFVGGKIAGSGEYGFGSDVMVSGGYAFCGNALVIKYEGAPPLDPDPPADTTPPIFTNLPGAPDTINIINGQTITTNPYVIKVKPEDDTAISKVEFYVDDNLICTETQADEQGVYSCAWDTSKYHSTITVYAYDPANNRSLALVRQATVDPLLYLYELPRTGSS